MTASNATAIALPLVMGVLPVSDGFLEIAGCRIGCGQGHADLIEAPGDGVAENESIDSLREDRKAREVGIVAEGREDDFRGVPLLPVDGDLHGAHLGAVDE